MDYGDLLSRAWNIVWNNKFLIMLGILVALGSGGGGGGGSGFRGSGNFGQQGDFGEPGQPGQFDFDEFEDFTNSPEFQQFLAIGVPIMIAVICVAVIIGIALGVVARIASGGLIAGVDQIEGVGASSFGQAWGAGWQKGWRLIGIGIVAALPGLAFALIALALIIPMIIAAGSIEDATAVAMASTGTIIALVVLGCLTALISIPLAALRGLADRACMLEDTPVFESYRRGWTVLTANLGEAVLLFLIQVGAGIALGLVLILPSIIMTICCILLPLLWAISGTITAYFSTMWTLAWRKWTGRLTSRGEPMPAPAPAV